MTRFRGSPAARWPRRALLASPALLLPGCAPDQAGPGAGLSAAGGPSGGAAPTPEQALSLVPEPVRRVAAEHPAFAAAPAPGFASLVLRAVPFADYAAEENVGRIGSLTASTRRFRSQDDVSSPVSVQLTIGGFYPLFFWGQPATADYDTVGGRNRIRFRQAQADRPFSYVLIDLGELEGSLFPLRLGNRLSLRYRTGRLSPQSTLIDPGAAARVDTVEVVKSWAPRALWQAILRDEVQIDLPPAYAGETHALHGEFHELRWGAGTRLYSSLLAHIFAESEAAPAAGRAIRYKASTVFANSTLQGRPLLPGEGVVLSAEGAARLAEARAALRAELDAAALRSARLGSAERSRATELFRIAFTFWQESNFNAAMTGLAQGLDIDPGNGIAHFYLTASAEGAYRSRTAPAAVAALQRFREYHMAAAARFAPGTREGLEAETFLRRNPG